MILIIAVVLILSLIGFTGTNCPALRAPPNGVLDRNCGTRVGNVCRIYCRNGYHLVGNPVHQCLSNNTWSGTTTQCVSPRHRCPHLNAPTNGYTVGECHTRVGCICTFACNSGYTLSGSSQVVCQRNCRWSARPTCVATTTTTTTQMTTTCGACSHTTTASSSDTQAYCPALQVPTHGVLSGSCGVAAPGAACSFACNSGYQLVGSSVSVCQSNGVWNNTVQCIAVTIRCASLGPPTNGVVSGYCSPGIPGQSCAFACNSGYHLVGTSATLTCQASGLWSTQRPVCAAN